MKQRARNSIVDLLNEGETFDVNYGKANFQVHPWWARIMVVKNSL
ncbi:MAG TPA: hypothetical protein PL110_08450 [Candidatus Eremiobacteraeota bacterium]|nr:MAG: hypothetical protein BWY64_00297 [bacterium ADurb.Bin363]HPZ08130.1 hypothetical protein [Candidatus Eremiobacteraeota bacterium]